MVTTARIKRTRTITPGRQSSSAVVGNLPRRRKTPTSNH